METPAITAELGLRKVRYVRYSGMGNDPEPLENSLLAFVYDIPYFGACGVFPPFHRLNEILMRGGSTGGMSPGATWEPFSLSSAEYRDLVDAVRIVPPETLRNRARYAHLAFIFDPEFDGDPQSYPIYPGYKTYRFAIPPEYQAYSAWFRAVCAKHRETHREALRRAGFLT